MKKYLYLMGMMVYTLTTGLYAASVEASVNTEEIVRGNAVQFSIRTTGGKAAFPQIRQIAGVGVTDSGTSTSTSMSITMNGTKQNSSTTRNYIFVPQHDMVIPSYSVRVGDQTLKTKPIKIKVIQSNVPALQNSNGYGFTMKSAKNQVVVGESFLLTLYLRINQRLGAQQVSEYVEPSSDAFFFKDLGKQKQYQKGSDTVIEKQYSVTAKKEGTFTISSASAKLGITDKSRQDLFGRYGIRWIEAHSNSINITVHSAQMQSDLVGEFTLNAKIDTQHTKANKPVNLTITIQGKGNLEDFEFPKYEIAGVTIYDDEASVESHTENGTLVSSYRKNFVFISDEDFVIPKRTLSVYNTQTKKIEKKDINAYNITVEKSKHSVSVSPKVSLPSVKVKTKQAEEVIKEVSVIPYWMLVVAFSLGMLIMYLFSFLPTVWHKKENPYKESQALKILYAHISESSEVEEMVKKLYARKNGDKSVQIDKKALKELVQRFR